MVILINIFLIFLWSFKHLYLLFVNFESLGIHLEILVITLASFESPYRGPIHSVANIVYSEQISILFLIQISDDYGS